MRPDLSCDWSRKSASSTTRARSTGPFSSLGRREKWSSDSTIRLARTAASVMSRRFSWSSGVRSASRLMSCAKARMPPSGLLISWATPPASWPTADIFSAWKRRRDTSRSSVTSLKTSTCEPPSSKGKERTTQVRSPKVISRSAAPLAGMAQRVGQGSWP